MFKTWCYSFFIIFALVMSFAEADEPGPASGDGITPVLNPKPEKLNPNCIDLGYMFGFKIDADPSDGTYQFSNTSGALTGSTPEDLNNSVTISNSGNPFAHFDWSSTMGIDAVIVKGGDGAVVYNYSPEDEGDTGLHTPINSNNGEFFGISHVEFCYDYEVDVSKTAVPEFTRTFAWDINKSVTNPEADPDSGLHELLLEKNQSYDIQYQVDASNESADSDFKVSGVIKIENNTPFDVVVNRAEDELMCGDFWNRQVFGRLTISSGSYRELQYSFTVPDNTTCENSVRVETDKSASPVGSGSAMAEAVFGEPSELVDECALFSDTLAGELGQLCVGDDPLQFIYSHTVSFPNAGSSDVNNTASFVTNVTSNTGEDSAVVSVTVVDGNGDGGCSLTPGYWKTHSKYGKAPYDDTWAQLGEDTPFFLSGMSYYEALWTPPKGNAYFILARAYIAAVLNEMNGSDTTDISQELIDAKALFEANDPSNISGKLRKEFISLGATLDEYNNGNLGPGHCDEDSSSSE